MTPLEKKVVSQELSKELVDNGIVLETVFYHFNGKVWMLHELNGRTMSEDNKPIPAPLLCEMLGVLPWYINHPTLKNVFWGQLGFYKNPNDFSITYGTTKETHLKLTYTKPAVAAAKMAITLKKKGLLNL